MTSGLVNSTLDIINTKLMGAVVGVRISLARKLTSRVRFSGPPPLKTYKVCVNGELKERSFATDSPYSRDEMPSSAKRNFGEEVATRTGGPSYTKI